MQSDSPTNHTKHTKEYFAREEAVGKGTLN